MPPLSVLLSLLPCLLQYSILLHSFAVADGLVQMEPTLPVQQTSCMKCVTEAVPPVTKCTNCEPTIRAKSGIDSECSNTLTCGSGRILIANNRYVITDVQCSHHSSDEEQVWIGRASDGRQIAIENAACFITPISCISLGSFSTRCPRGFICSEVQMNDDQSLVSCREKGWKQDLKEFFHIYVNRKQLWFRNNDKWEHLKEDLKCDPKLGAWVETVPVKTEKDGVGRSIITDRLICGKQEFKLFGKMVIDHYLAEICVLTIQICLPILVFLGGCIFTEIRKRSFLRDTKTYLDEQFKYGKESKREIKEKEKATLKRLIDRWREVNKFVVEKNKPTVQAYLKKEKGKRR